MGNPPLQMSHQMAGDGQNNHHLLHQLSVQPAESTHQIILKMQYCSFTQQIAFRRGPFVEQFDPFRTPRIPLFNMHYGMPVKLKYTNRSPLEAAASPAR